jgi:hypothetical protein
LKNVLAEHEELERTGKPIIRGDCFTTQKKPKMHSDSQGCFSFPPENNLNTDGTFSWTNGKVVEPYVGETKDGKPHGQGTLRWPNGDYYIGGFKDGNFHGQGVYSWNHSNRFARYEGEYRNGRKHGVGSFVGSLASYEGEWKDGRPDGYGASHHPRAYGEDYWGYWKDGKRHGRGTIAWYGIGHSGSFKGGGGYYGDFKDNRFHGNGILTWPLELDGICRLDICGKTYDEGQISFLKDFLDNLFSCFDGVENPIYPEKIDWESSLEFDDSMGFSNEPPRLLKVYSGEFKYGTRNGRGTFLCPGRSVTLYEGDYKDGKRHGQGIVRINIGTSDEAEFTGDWRRGYWQEPEPAQSNVVDESTVAFHRELKNVLAEHEELERTGKPIIRGDCFITETEDSEGFDQGFLFDAQKTPFDMPPCTIAVSQAAIIADEKFYDITPRIESEATPAREPEKNEESREGLFDDVEF